MDLKPARVVGLALLLAGCAHYPAFLRPHAQVQPAATKTPAGAPPVSVQQHLDRAVDLLQRGDSAEAEKELKACLAGAPDHKAAKFLLAQIETPVAQLYPKDNFTVVLDSDDTLSGLAERYLGNPLAFYGLARYNAIAQPAKIVAGQPFRIPKTRTAIAAVADNDPPAPPESGPPENVAPEQESGTDGLTDFDLFDNAVKSARFVDAAEVADKGHLPTGKVKPPLLANVYLQAANVEKNDDPASADWHAREAGLLYLSVLKNDEAARTAFLLALSAESSDSAAQTGLTMAVDRLAAKYFRRGLIAFQRQDLDGAIAAWDKVLAIKPSDSDAQLNRAQAIHLRANLQKLRG